MSARRNLAVNKQFSGGLMREHLMQKATRLGDMPRVLSTAVEEEFKQINFRSEEPVIDAGHRFDANQERANPAQRHRA